jgi:hypothetical protein
MRTLALLATILTLALWISACEESEPTHTDPDGLVTFIAPDGWAVRSESNGTRFGRIQPESERSVLFVKAAESGEARTLEQLREIRLSQIRSQGSEIAIDKQGSMKGFTTWERLATSPPDSSRPWMHSIHLFSDGPHVEVGLIAAAEKHADYVDDLEAVANSIEVR